MSSQDIITIDEEIQRKQTRSARRKATLKTQGQGRFNQRVERNKKRYTRKIKHKD